MKRIHVVMVMVFVLSLVSAKMYGAEPLKRPSGVGGNPAAVLLINQGIGLFAKGQLDQALSSFDMAIQMDKTLSDAYFNAGIVALELGMREKGFSYLETFASQRPEEGRAFLSGRNNATVAIGADSAPSSGFWEFGLPAMLGSVFIFAAGAYLISHSQAGIPSFGSGLFVMGFAKGRLFPEKTIYMVYPMLKRAYSGSPIGLCSLMERRGHKDWQLSASAA
jgi:tetratricopeptide (TPR) repeat protein